MNKSIGSTNFLPQRPGRVHGVLLTVAVTALTRTFSASVASQSGDSYSSNILRNPSPPVLLAESRGRVTVYDGLDNQVVEEALDTQFNRIQSMMFVNTRYQEVDGSVTEDDDCD